MQIKPQLLSEDAGSGEINSATSWDEFPNGRFGDFKSPAYGVQDLWNANALGALGVSVSIFQHLECSSDNSTIYSAEQHLIFGATLRRYKT